jgi:hypothetical protein
MASLYIKKKNNDVLHYSWMERGYLLSRIRYFMRFPPPFAAIHMLSMSRAGATASRSCLFVVGLGRRLHQPHRRRLIHRFEY